MTVTVSFNTPQIQVSNSSTGIQLSQVILPYSIRNSEDSTQYLGGQMTLGQSDGIKLTDNTNDWERLGLAKVKAMVADAEIYVPDPIIEVPASSSAVEAPLSSAEDSVANSASDSVASSATVASSAVESPESSATAGSVASSAESQVTTAPSESTMEA